MSPLLIHIINELFFFALYLFHKCISCLFNQIVISLKAWITSVWPFLGGEEARERVPFQSLLRHWGGNTKAKSRCTCVRRGLQRGEAMLPQGDRYHCLSPVALHSCLVPAEAHLCVWTLESIGRLWFPIPNSFVWFRRTPLWMYFSPVSSKKPTQPNHPLENSVMLSPLTVDSSLMGGGRKILPKHKYFTLDYVFEQCPPPPPTRPTPHTFTQTLRPKMKISFSPSSSTLQGCWMILKGDSLGNTMEQIKVYLLNGLTRRWMEDKQEGWLEVASHDRERLFCGDLPVLRG